jgi:uncharacterized protein (DUF1501 family)
VPRARAGVRLFVPRAGLGEETAPRTLVLLQLSGGNDGLSTVVPYGDDLYARNRNATRIGAGEVLALDAYRGLHPELKALRRIYDEGRIAIVEGAGYPDPVRSHFKSMEVWHTARAAGRSSGEGWIGRLCDAAWGTSDTAELVVHVGANAPYSLHSTKHPAVSFQTPASYQWVAPEDEDGAMYRRAAGSPAGSKTKTGGDDVLARLRGVLSDAQASSIAIRRAAASYRPSTAYPDDELGQALRVVAALIDARIGTRVLSVELGGFDSHNDQRRQHDGCMRTLDAALAAFLDDLRGRAAGDQVLVVAFSEFGRRLAENGSRGTDHGVAGPMFVAGSAVKGGLYGKHPSLADLDEGDLVATTDFRSVYGTVVERWFGVVQEKVLGGKYPEIALLEA